MRRSLGVGVSVVTTALLGAGLVVGAVQNATGPSLLQPAAKDAIRKWRFKPFVRDGQPVKAIGFVNFNFSL